MSPPLWLEFADPASGLRGWFAGGGPGLGDGEGAALLFDGEEEIFAGRSASVTVSENGAGARAELASEAASVAVVIDPPSATGPVSAGPATVDLERGGERRSLRCSGAYGEAGGDGDLLRSLLALREDGSTLALRSARPAGERDHAAERTEAWLLGADGVEPRAIGEPLLSTEYDRGGAQARAGLELWVGEEDELPIRGAGTRVAGSELELDGWRLGAAFFNWSVEGVNGAGSYLIWHRVDG